MAFVVPLQEIVQCTQIHSVCICDVIVCLRMTFFFCGYFPCNTFITSFLLLRWRFFFQRLYLSNWKAIAAQRYTVNCVLWLTLSCIPFVVNVNVVVIAVGVLFVVFIRFDYIKKKKKTTNKSPPNLLIEVKCIIFLMMKNFELVSLFAKCGTETTLYALGL